MGQVTEALKTLQQALADFWYQWVVLVLINTLWLLCSATIVLAPPALFGLFYATNELANGRGVGYADFIAGLRQYFKISWLWGVLNIIAAFLVWLNIQFYGQIAESWSLTLLFLTLLLGATWLMVQLLTIPYLIEQERKHLGIAMKNALFTLLATPLYSVLLALFVGAFLYLVVTQAIAVLLGGVCMIALLSNRAVLNRLQAFGLRERTETAPESEAAFPLYDVKPIGEKDQDSEKA
jgi:uncharacterized membrane protein YesL